MRSLSWLVACRHTSELPLTTQIANKGVASLLGVGYMILHAWEARVQPSTNYLQFQVAGAAGTSGLQPVLAQAGRG